MCFWEVGILRLSKDEWKKLLAKYHTVLTRLVTQTRFSDSKFSRFFPYITVFLDVLSHAYGALKKRKVGKVCLIWGGHVFPTSLCLLKKNAQRESFQLNFIWGKMRITAQVTAPQKALRNCSKEVGGEDIICVILVKREYMQSSTYFFRRFLLVSWSFLLVTKNSCHHEGL